MNRVEIEGKDSGAEVGAMSGDSTPLSPISSETAPQTSTRGAKSLGIVPNCEPKASPVHSKNVTAIRQRASIHSANTKTRAASSISGRKSRGLPGCPRTSPGA